MKAITVKQPWASLICSGLKDIENRTWKTNFRGRVLIHSSAKAAVDYKHKSLMGFWGIGMTDEMIIKANDFGLEHGCRWDEWLKINSAIIGSVEIVDLAINHPSIWAEKSGFKPIYNWVLANPILFDRPIPAKGKLSFWESEVELCHICGKPTTKDYECQVCHEFYCEQCSAKYDQFTQIDYNCCSQCAER